MVADKIEVYSKSSHPDSQGFLWSSDGSGKYTIQVGVLCTVDTGILIARDSYGHQMEVVNILFR